MEIFICRHGQSIANAEHVVAGQHESELSEYGEQQASITAEAATTYGFDAIVSSPMQRTLATAVTIADQIHIDREHIVIIDELKERNLGILEEKHYDETPYGNGNTEHAEEVPGIEPLDHLHERVSVALEKVHQLKAKRVLVVCHNGTGRMLQVIAKGLLPSAMYQQPRLENATIYALGKYAQS